MIGFITSYCGVRYHLKEYKGFAPRNSRELFNLRHATSLTIVNSAFGICKSYYKIITTILPI